MEIKDLTALITELSQISQKSESEIIADLSEIAKVKYGTYIEDNERSIIEGIKEKFIVGLYRMANHSYVTSRPNPKEKFGLDDLEMKYLEKALNELDGLDLLEGGHSYMKLKEKGILRAKELRGEL